MSGQSRMNNRCLRKVVADRVMIGDDQFDADVASNFRFVSAGDAAVNGNDELSPRLVQATYRFGV